MGSIDHQPTIIAEIPLNESRASRLIRLQEEISRRPGVFLRAFNSLGEDATSNTFERSDDRVDTIGISVNPREMIKEFFTKQDDKAVRLDAATEDALYDNPEYGSLIRAAKDAGAQEGNVRAGGRAVAKPDTTKERNAVRRFEFGFFLRRTVEWSRQQIASNRLPNAG